LAVVRLFLVFKTVAERCLIFWTCLFMSGTLAASFKLATVCLP